VGGVCSKGSLVYRAFSTSITNATLPSGLRNGNGLPVYLSEMGSIYLQSPSGAALHDGPLQAPLIVLARRCVV